MPDSVLLIYCSRWFSFMPLHPAQVKDAFGLAHPNVLLLFLCRLHGLLFKNSS